jgi:hypothetical protein
MRMACRHLAAVLLLSMTAGATAQQPAEKTIPDAVRLFIPYKAYSPEDNQRILAMFKYLRVADVSDHGALRADEQHPTTATTWSGDTGFLGTHATSTPSSGAFEPVTITTRMSRVCACAAFDLHAVS